MNNQQPNQVPRINPLIYIKPQVPQGQNIPGIKPNNTQFTNNPQSPHLDNQQSPIGMQYNKPVQNQQYTQNPININPQPQVNQFPKPQINPQTGQPFITPPQIGKNTPQVPGQGPQIALNPQPIGQLQDKPKTIPLISKPQVPQPTVSPQPLIINRPLSNVEDFKYEFPTNPTIEDKKKLVEDFSKYIREGESKKAFPLMKLIIENDIRVKAAV